MVPPPTQEKTVSKKPDEVDRPPSQEKTVVNKSAVDPPQVMVPPPPGDCGPCCEVGGEEGPSLPREGDAC